MIKFFTDKEKKPRIIRVFNNLGPCSGCIGEDNTNLCFKLPKCTERQDGKLRNFIFIYKEDTK